MRPIWLIRIIFVIVGVFAGLIYIGLAYHQNKENPDMLKLLNDAYVPEPQVFLIVIGTLIIITSLIGLIKGLRTSAIGIIVLVIVLSIITTVVVAMAAIIFVTRNKFLKQTGIVYDRTWINRDDSKASELLHSINQYLRCCGRYSLIDYFPYIPPSCCDVPVNNVCPDKDIYTEGCRDALYKFVDKKADLIGYVSVAVALMLIIIIVFHIIEYIRQIDPEFLALFFQTLL